MIELNRLALAGLSLCTGCAQLFGLDATSGAPDAPATALATVEIERLSIGATVAAAPEDITATLGTLAFLVADPGAPGGYRSVVAMQGPTGTWTGPVPDGDPMVDVTLGGERHLWALPTRDLKIADVALEHPDPTAAPANSALALSVTLPAASAGSTFELDEIGPWLVADVTPATSVTTITAEVETSAMTALGGAPAAGVIAQDVVLVLGYTGAQLTGAFQANSFAETDGANTVAGAMAAVTADQSFGASVDPTSLLTRFAAVRPAVGTPVLSWSLSAAPGSMRGVPDGPQLMAGSVAPADTAIGAMYGNPFAAFGWSTLFEYDTSETRDLMVGTLALELSAGATSVLVPDGTMATLDLPAAIPQTISLDDQPLSTDNTTVTVDPTTSATISIVVDRQVSTLYQAILYEVVPTDATMTTAKLAWVVDVQATDPANLILPPDALQVGHTYTLRVGCLDGGFTGAATGDLQTTSPPFNSAYNFSGVFTVTNP